MIEPLTEDKDEQIAELTRRVSLLDTAIKVYASGHHDDHHVGSGAEDYTDCTESICLATCIALGWTALAPTEAIG